MLRMNIARTEHNNNRLSATSAVSAATNGAISGVATNGAAFHHTPAAQVIINGITDERGNLRQSSSQHYANGSAIDVKDIIGNHALKQGSFMGLSYHQQQQQQQQQHPQQQQQQSVSSSAAANQTHLQTESSDSTTNTSATGRNRHRSSQNDGFIKCHYCPKKWADQAV
ncbi:unnamed protein product [Dracunculus medinensis]|uniref:C2H2-type domain-containing protein n=1 Tax=Dracunculus medinensis TaxID=318479 RepID=A0A0N4U614_DRAME|nr:unnamed protein product [Dracunculus medinensis]